MKKQKRLCDLSARHLFKIVKAISSVDGGLTIVGFVREPVGVKQEHEDRLQKYGIEYEYVDQRCRYEDSYYGHVYWPYSEKLWMLQRTQF